MSGLGENWVEELFEVVLRRAKELYQVQQAEWRDNRVPVSYKTARQTISATWAVTLNIVIGEFLEIHPDLSRPVIAARLFAVVEKRPESKHLGLSFGLQSGKVVSYILPPPPPRPAHADHPYLVRPSNSVPLASSSSSATPHRQR